MSMTVKVQGREYTLSLGEDAQIWCKELGISGPNVQSVKEQVKGRVAKEKAAPRVNILSRGNNHWNDKTEYFEGTAADVPADRQGYRWITWLDKKGHAKRRKVSISNVWLDTPENRSTLDLISTLAKQVDDIEHQIRELESQLTRLGSTDEE